MSSPVAEPEEVSSSSAALAAASSEEVAAQCGVQPQQQQDQQDQQEQQPGLKLPLLKEKRRQKDKQEAMPEQVAEKPAKAMNLVYAPIFLLYLGYMQAMSLLYLVLQFLGSGVTHAGSAGHLLSLLGTVYATTRRSRPVLDDTKRPVVFLCNHRSWGDFLIDAALLGGASFVARRAVAAAIPLSALWGWAQGWLWLFNREAKHPEGTTKFMTDFFRESHARCPGKGVVMFPEGTRSQEPKGLPLKAGGLSTVYQLGWPVQVVITTNKEHVMLEKTFELGRGVQCVTAISEPLWPQDFQSAEAFVQAVRTTWTNTWAEAYNAAPSDTVARKTALLPGAVRKSGKSSRTRSRM